MNYTIEYFHFRVQAEIESWPDGILADYARLIELLMEFGPSLKCLIPKQWEKVSLSCGQKEKRESDGHFTAFLLVGES